MSLSTELELDIYIDGLHDEILRLKEERLTVFIAGWKAHITGPRGNPIDEVAAAAYYKMEDK